MCVLVFLKISLGIWTSKGIVHQALILKKFPPSKENQQNLYLKWAFGVVPKPYLKLLFCLSRGDRRFEKPGRKDPGMVLLLCGQQMGGRSRVCLGACTYISLSYCSKFIVDTRFVILCQVAKCVLKALFLLLCVVLTIGHLSVVDQKRAVSRFCLFNSVVMSTSGTKFLYLCDGSLCWWTGVLWQYTFFSAALNIPGVGCFGTQDFLPIWTWIVLNAC